MDLLFEEKLLVTDDELLELITLTSELELLLVSVFELEELDLLDADWGWLLAIELAEAVELMLDVGNGLSAPVDTWLEEVMVMGAVAPELVNPEPPELPPPQAVKADINKRLR